MGNASSNNHYRKNSKNESQSRLSLLSKIKERTLYKSQPNLNEANSSTQQRKSSITSSFSNRTTSGSLNDSATDSSPNLNKVTNTYHNRKNSKYLESYTSNPGCRKNSSELKFKFNQLEATKVKPNQSKPTFLPVNNIRTLRPMALRPKTNPIYEDYVISKQVLGLGISGKVLCCVNKQTKVKYALKTLRESVKAKREIDLHWRACQNCPYLVQIVDVYENTINTQKVILVIMECMEGGELFAKISERTKSFTEQEVAKIMYQICTAVKHLHTMNIAHRDLKPENLLLTSNDENAVIKLTDFGFAKEVNLGLVTPCYTPYYVAPEVLGSERYDISCDIWSLGVIMYILCCGYPPFYSTHGQPISPGMKRRIKAGEYTFPEAEWSRVSQDAKKLISGMLETIPEKRSTINDIMKSNWISSYYDVPPTPLPSLDILKEDREMWSEIQQNMGKALDEMRINWDSKIQIKELTIVNNPLFDRRMKKTKGSQNLQKMESASKKTASMPPPAQPAPIAFSEPMIVEEYSREQSMITPTNSVQHSPDRK